MRVVHLDRGRLTITNPAGAGALFPGMVLPALPCMLGVAVSSRDLPGSRAALHAERFQLAADHADLLCVAPDDALGA